ncbi:hypothetical protein KBX06_26785 [Micromonospora sp. C31]|uniref:hypothetical protein n=1 Tax=Micromonospora sp. C31 TaxID=2824876 RepID=UPI001B35BC9D|nr:hypothetical protein [Micromonospora sp. C31]MBQ1076728.1 hypothetical protein [Micromonospora sp. C31]
MNADAVGNGGQWQPNRSTTLRLLEQDRSNQADGVAMAWLRRRWVLVAVVAAAALGLLVWLFWPKPVQDPAPRERTYQAFTACLLTDDKGLAGESARAAWDGMQQASLAESFKVQYLAVNGPQTEANASAYFNSLGLQGCGVIVGVGEAPVAALVAGKSRFPTTRYVMVGGPAAVPGVARVEASPVAGVDADVRAEVASAYAAASGN